MPDDDLTPEEEQVRRLLAGARHTEPMPADVAARLDAVIAGLGDELGPAPTRVDEIAAARRRRTVRNWLVAAAAVVVVGVGINQVDWSGMSMSSDDADSGSDSVAAEAGGADDNAPQSTTEREQDSDRWRRARLLLTSGRFGAQVEEFRLQRADGEGALPSTPSYESGLSEGSAAYDYSVVCDVGHLGRGQFVPVKYEGERAWLVFREPEGESQVVDLYLCGSEEPIRSITLPIS